mgnify:CR=1 FL=1
MAQGLKLQAQGSAEAECALGYAYSVGLGVAKDEAEAVKWYRRSASQRHNLSRGPVAAVSWILDLPFFSRQRRSPWGWSEPTDERWGYERLAEHC